jgi:TRAP-type uncharacterized transport system substrate-binding protein
MLMALYYEPLWIFYRDPATLTQLDELRGKHVAIGSPGSGVRAFIEPLLVANEITSANTSVLRRQAAPVVEDSLADDSTQSQARAEPCALAAPDLHPRAWPAPGE